MQAPGEGELLVHARSRHEAEVALAPGETLRWALRAGTHRLNVGVTLLLSSEDGSLERSKPLHEVAPLSGADGVVGGAHTNDNEAHVGQPAEQRVVFTLDNTFSRTKTKVLAYRVWITTEQEDLCERKIAAALSTGSGDSSPPPPPPVDLEIGMYPRLDAPEADWNVLSARLRKDGWTDPGPEYDGTGASALVGHRVFVRGRGEGRVTGYTYHKLRASSHEIQFGDGWPEAEATTIYLESSAGGKKSSDDGYVPFLIDLNAIVRIHAEECKGFPVHDAATAGIDTGKDTPSLETRIGLPWRPEDASAWCRLRDVRGEQISAHSRTPQHLPPPPPKQLQADGSNETAAAIESNIIGTAAVADSDNLAERSRARLWTGFADEGESRAGKMSGDSSTGHHHLFDTFVMLGAGESMLQKFREFDQSLPDQLHCEPDLVAVYPPCDDEGRRESLRMFCCPDDFEIRLAEKPHGNVPQSPDYEQYIFRMTEGLAAPVPLYGACVKTLELITIEQPTGTESTDASTTTRDTDATTAAETLGGRQTTEDAAPGTVHTAPKTSSSIPAPRRRGIRVRRRQRAGIAEPDQDCRDGTDTPTSSTVYLAPRCYCLLSRSPHFELLFATLYGLLRAERRHSNKDQVVLDVEVPAEQHTTTSHSHLIEVVHGEGVFTALLPGLKRRDEAMLQGDATNRVIVAGQHFQLTVPSPWMARNLSGVEYELSKTFRESLDRARRLQPGSIGSTFNIPANVFGVGLGGTVWGPDRIPDRSTAYSLWALGTALEHCSVEVLLTAATALLLERPLIVLHPRKAARSAVVFALLALLGPWRYPHTCLPLVPPTMYELATAPVPFVLGMPSAEDLAPFGQDARAASVLCATTGRLREGTPPGIMDAEAEATPLPLSEIELQHELLLEPEPEIGGDANAPYTPRQTVYRDAEQAAEAETDDGSMMTLSELEFGQALLGQGGVASLSSQLRPKAAALWQARRYAHSSSHAEAENGAVRSFMETVLQFHAELGEAVAADDGGDVDVHEDPFVQQFKLSSIWQQHGN